MCSDLYHSTTITVHKLLMPDAEESDYRACDEAARCITCKFSSKAQTRDNILRNDIEKSLLTHARCPIAIAALPCCRLRSCTWSCSRAVTTSAAASTWQRTRQTLCCTALQVRQALRVIWGVGVHVMDQGVSWNDANMGSAQWPFPKVNASPHRALSPPMRCSLTFWMQSQLGDANQMLGTGTEAHTPLAHPLPVQVP